MGHRLIFFTILLIFVLDFVSKVDEDFVQHNMALVGFFGRFVDQPKRKSQNFTFIEFVSDEEHVLITEPKLCQHFAVIKHVLRSVLRGMTGIPQVLIQSLDAYRLTSEPNFKIMVLKLKLSNRVSRIVFNCHISGQKVSVVYFFVVVMP